MSNNDKSEILDEFEYSSESDDDVAEPLIPTVVWSSYNRGCVRSPTYRSHLKHDFYNIYRYTSKKPKHPYMSALAVVQYSAEDQDTVDRLYHIINIPETGTQVEVLHRATVSHIVDLYGSPVLLGHLPELNLEAFDWFASNNETLSEKGERRLLDEKSVDEALSHPSARWADSVMQEVWERGMMRRPEDIRSDPSLWSKVHWAETLQVSFIIALAVAACYTKYMGD